MSSRPSRTSHPTANQFCPRLEALEDRSLMSVIPVLTTEDNGDNAAPTPGSLRAAIVAANTTRERDEIVFAIKPADAGHVYYHNDGHAGQVSLGEVLHTNFAYDADILEIDTDWPHSWWSIRPTEPLPEIKYPLSIDGYTQSGATGNSLAVGSNAVLRIELDGEFAGPANGFVAHSAITVNGLVINRFAGSGLVGGSGIWLDRCGADTVIQGNTLGLDVSGTVDGIGNMVAGLRTTNAGAQIGGPDPKARNTISGNTLGILLNNGGGNFHPVIQGNYIGTSLSGSQDRGNSSSGVSILSAPGTLVGGAGQGAGNVISGNDTGVWINGNHRRALSGRFNYVVQGNIIGLNASGQAALGNNDGVQIRDSDTLIGGLTPTPGRGAGNVISGNDENGISVERLRVGAWVGPRVEGTVVQGNIIGLDASGMARLGNGSAGFRTRDAGAQVGGAAPGARNIISANQYGVLLSNSGTDYHPVIQGNRIGTDITGNLDRGNSVDGVNVGSAPGTRVGGAAPGAGNVVSGNGTGVFINGISHTVIAGAYNCLVQGNIIGLNFSATQPVGNATGVLITNSYNLIGGAWARGVEHHLR